MQINLDKGEIYYLIDDYFGVLRSSEAKCFIDDARFGCGNYFTSATLAEKVAKHLKQSFWFTRKAIEFADGYEFVEGEVNFMTIWNGHEWVKASIVNYRAPSDIFMTKQNAEKFVEWLNIHKPEGA